MMSASLVALGERHTRRSIIADHYPPKGPCLSLTDPDHNPAIYN
nr:MAG TPA: hypothetical protein [Caudoviricetes sp.]